MRHFISFVRLVVLFLLTACQPRTFNQSESLDTELDSVERIRFDRKQLLSEHRFERITPTGEKIFEAARAWEMLQETQANLYAQPLQSANNVSNVLEMAGLSEYSSPSPWALVALVKRMGGIVIQFPKNTRTIARIIEDHFEGALPVGMLISGCVSRTCEVESGEVPLGVVGQVDNAHVIHVWHNNGFRPENRLWREHMIPLGWYQAGFPRKWMSTPWLTKSNDSQGMLVDVRSAVPEMIELDPSSTVLTAIVVPEIVKELKEFQSVMTDGNGAVMPFRSRSVTRRAQPIELTPMPELIECKSHKADSPAAANLRRRPRGELICQLSQGTRLEWLTQEKIGAE